MWSIIRSMSFASRLRRDDGMSTAEYAVGTVAAAAFGLVLHQIVSSGAVSDALQDLVERALAGDF
jgi:hypothetical protein